jgi:hypothetical protein
MSRGATPWLPKRSPRGPRRGNRAAVGGQTAPTYSRGANRGHIFLWKTLLGPSRCAPERGPRGPACSGDRAAAGMQETAQGYCWGLQPATGPHLPSEETAPPFAVYSHRRLSRIPFREVAVVQAEFVQYFLAIPVKIGFQIMSIRLSRHRSTIGASHHA